MTSHQITPLAQALQARIEAALPGAVVVINDPDGAHLSAVVTAPQFAGLSRIAQHKLVYAALAENGESAFATTLHALQLTTRAAA